MIKMTEFAKRRKQLIQKIGSNGIVILVAAPIAIRNNDCAYFYRQQSDFYYLTGFEEPDAVAILLPHKKNEKFILFNRTRDREREIWDGFRAGQEGACKHFGADEAYPIEALATRLPEILEDHECIHYALGLNKSFDAVLMDSLNTLRGRVRRGSESPLAIVDPSHTIHEMRLIKSSAEIALMRKAAEISVDAHIRAMQFCKPGMNEYQLDAELSHEFQRQGARFTAYHSIVGSGANTCILHYHNNNQVIQNQDLVLIDAGCEYQYYASDITRTFPANGTFSADQRAVYDIVLAAQEAGIHTIKPGASWIAAQQAMVKIMTQGLIELGLLKGKLATLIEERAYFPFYMHHSGHWLGLDVHDVGRYKALDKWRTLEPGMVLTVEPGIYLSRDIPGIPKRWHNIGIRIEDDILVTETGHDVLTKRLPKKIKEIEGLMAQ